MSRYFFKIKRQSKASDFLNKAYCFLLRGIFKNEHKKIFHRINTNINAMEKRRVVMKPSLKLSLKLFQAAYFFAPCNLFTHY